MRRIMQSFSMREISGVDRPAQKPATVAIIKREDAMLYTSIEKGDLPADVLAYIKREFSAEQRERAASSGAAESDGSFPIENATDLHNAMRAIGRSKNPAKTKAHIRSRAKALGLESELSDAFKRAPLVEKFMTLFRKEEAPAVDAVIEKSVTALAQSVASIVADDTADKASALGKTFAQFHEFISKALAAGGAVAKSEESDMDIAALKKLLGLADAATEPELNAELAKFAGLKTTVGKLQSDLAIAKAAMSDDEKSFHDGLKDDDAKEKFRGMSRDERAERMKKRSDDLPEHIKKALARADENEKRLAKLEDERALDGFTKQAKDASLPEADGVTLQKAYRGDKESVDKLLGYVKAANAAAKAAGLFKEIGGASGNTTLTAYDELVAKADELRKGDKSLTRDQAFAKVYADPANSDLAKRERSENRPQAA